MKSKILFYFVFLLSITISFTSADELKIKLKIENEIITNYDISDEINYLISLNNNLKKLSKKQIKILANESSIKDKIKYIELNKYFDLNKKDANLEKIILQNLKYRLKKIQKRN